MLKRIFCIFGFALSAAALASPAAARPTAAEADVLRTINQVRAEHRLAPLRLDLRLERAARAHTLGMIRAGSFAHGDVRGRLARHGIRTGAYGENLAWGVGSRVSAAAVVRMWLNSPPHRANLLRPSFRRIGIGRAVATFQGYGGAAVLTADFAG